jgi:aryl-alcohol dehydrogenase-like predicted oxidoreductase
VSLALSGLKLSSYFPVSIPNAKGEYDDNLSPDNARLTLFGDMFTRYTKPKGKSISRKFNDLANLNGLTPSKMALAFVNSRNFLTSNIIGATNIDQLEENIDSINTVLSSDILENIEKIHDENPYPCP